MGLFGPRRSNPPLAAARTAPQSLGLMGAGALALAGITQDPYTASPVTRTQALSVPALNAGVGVLTNLAGQLPLTASSPVGVSDDTKTFLATLDPTMPCSWTQAKTVESLIFHGVSYWLITKRYATGFPATIEYVDFELVQEITKGRNIDHYRVADGYAGETWQPKDVIRFVGVLPGILTSGAAAIRTALANIHATRMVAEHPSPHMLLADDDGAESLESDEATEMLDALNTAVGTRGMAYLGGLKIIQYGWNARELQLVEARDADAVEMARLLSIPTHYANAANKGSSLTYSNLADTRRDKIDALAGWAIPMEGRLSLPDVTPRGTVVKLDAASFVDQVAPTEPPAPPTDPTPPDPNPHPKVQTP